MSTHTKTDSQALLEYLDVICRASPHTIKSYRYSLELYADFLRRRSRCARTADFDDIVAFVAWLRGQPTRRGEPPKPNTVALRLAAVKKLHWYLHARGQVDRDVAALVPKGKRDRGRRPAPPLEQVIAARDTLTTYRDRSIFGLLYGSAMRISSVRYALTSDVDLDAGTITFVGKGRKLQTVELDGYTADALESWLTRRATNRGPWLYPSYKPGQVDAPMTEVPIRHMLARAARAVGCPVDELLPHALRRVRGRTLRRAGADPWVIRDTYGHDHTRTTAGYVVDEGEAPTLPEHVREAIRQLERAAVRHPPGLPATG